MIIAIDGPAAAGKGAIASRLARHYGFHHLDTGLLYRATALKLVLGGFVLEDEEAATAAASGLQNCDLASAELRQDWVGDAASRVAVYRTVREALLAFQRSFASRAPGAVLDGRDIGTVVCPDADVKIFVTAAPEVRALRRTADLANRGAAADYDTVLADILKRDQRDRSRNSAPLAIADGAVTLDTSELSLDSSVAAAVAIVDSARGGLARPSPETMREAVSL